MIRGTAKRPEAERRGEMKREVNRQADHGGEGRGTRWNTLHLALGNPADVRQSIPTKDLPW